MCGIGGIVRIHSVGSQAAAALAGVAWESFTQRCEDGTPVGAQRDGGSSPYGAGPWTIPEQWLDILDGAVSYRGPDGWGRFRDAAVRADGSVVEVAFVHRRLSIIDIEGGAQPMVAQGGDGGAVVFNGCVYNHRVLRAELERLGHTFETDHSDTEVLIRGWRQWGPGVVWRLRAMYAWALWERGSARVLVGRDCFGERPLYLLGEPGAGDRAFASSAAGLHRLAQVADLDGADPIEQSWLVRWVANGYDNERSPWGSIIQLRQGLVLSLSGERESADPDRADDADAAPADRPGNPWLTQWPQIESQGMLVERIDGMIRSVVDERLDADVPVACLLSGGIDSSLVAAAARRDGRPLVTISVRMPDARYDESAAAQRVAEIIGSEHHTVDASDNAADDLVHLIETLGLPFGDSSLLPTYWACRAARPLAKVLLTGDGGDELFAGYERYQVADRIGSGWWIPRWLGTDRWAGPDPKSRRSKFFRLLSAAAHGGYVDLISIFPTPDRRRVLKGRWRAEPVADFRPSSFDTARRFDLDEHLPGDMLRKVDHASLLAGVEVRSPLLDWAFGQAILRGLSKGVLLPQVRRKGLLREVARLHLPDEIVDRPKMGFAIPIGEWFRNDHGGMRSLLRDHLQSGEPWGPESLGIAEMIDMRCVRRMLREHDRAGGASVWSWKGRDHSQRLYMLLVLSIWARRMGSARARQPTREAPRSN